jgi:hypothetical protein
LRPRAAGPTKLGNTSPKGALMRVDFIGHASLLIQSQSLRLLTDPWWEGPAYRGQWFPYPFPVPERFDLSKLDALYISHGHEDHLHAPTLAGVTKDLTVVIPRSYDDGNVTYLRSVGFDRIEQLPNGGRLVLRRGAGRLTLTLFTALGDSILAVDDGREVLLNLNDALHYARPDVIEAYCRLLRARFPRIDYLFCGYGSASYFPNCFRVPGKDDVKVAEKREHRFLQNFALITQKLVPKHAFPFAASFVLPDERNWWISELRLKMPRPSEILAPLCGGLPTRIHDLAPGDSVENGVIHTAPRIREPAPSEVRRLVLERYPQPVRPERIDAGRFRALVQRLRDNARLNVRRLGSCKVDAAVSLWDYPDETILVSATNRSATVETRARGHARSPQVLLETRSDLLEAALDEEYGRDHICIGYGGLVSLSSLDAVRSNTHELLFRLMTPFSTWGERLRKNPIMCMSFLARDPGARHAAMQKLLRLSRPASPNYTLLEWT